MVGCAALATSIQVVILAEFLTPKMQSFQRLFISRALVRHLVTQSKVKTIQDIAPPVELEVKTPWGQLAVKDWGPKDGYPIVGIHGWQTNSASFDKLIPLLPANLRVVVPDYSGHGRSSHRPQGTYYGPLEFASDIQRVVDHLKLDKFTVLTHSYGFLILTLYYLLNPNRVKNIISLDFGTPEFVPFSVFPHMVNDYLKDELKAERRHEAPPSYTLDEAIKIYIESTQGSISEESAKVVLSRGLRQLEGTNRVVFSRDPRIKHCRVLASPFFQETDAVFRKYKKDMLMMLTDDQMFTHGKDPKHTYRNLYAENCRLFRFVETGGTHYVHLNEPEKVATHITDFLVAVDELDKKAGC